MYVRVNVWWIVVAAALVGACLGRVTSPREALAEPSEGSARHVTAMVGAVNGNQQTIYVVDAIEQSLMVYEHGLGRGGLDFVASRSFKSDKMLEIFDIELTRGQSPTPKQVRQLYRKMTP